mgnify:FL=1|tara:strand:- start:1937 stop:2194 length:258 start_codon:yes stop_codon:yes gene_type:complete
MTPQQTELTAYLIDVMAQLKILQSRASKRNKTKKFKAITSMLTITWSRANATYNYVKAGGHDDFSVIIQQQMYDPIIQWLESEIA